MRLLEIGNRFVRVPEKWNELTATQLAAMMDIFHNKKLTEDGREIQLFQAITGISFFRLWVIGAQNLADLTYVTRFLFGDNTLTTNVLPAYKKRAGAADNFDNLVISEFVFSEMHYTAFKYAESSPQEKAASLDNLVAVLYRPIKAGYNLRLNIDGDPREPFNENVIPYSASQISRWPLKIKQSIFHWYEGSRLSLIEAFPEVFSGDGGDADGAKYGLWDLMYNIADKGTFGDFATVEKQYLKTILMALTKIMMEAERLSQKN